jgi:hypothetical protein
LTAATHADAPAPISQSHPTDLQPFLELGIPREQAEKAVRYLRADGSSNGTLSARSRRLARLANACGSLQNAKLAYSLASRSGGEPDDQGVRLLSASLSCCDCVPAAVRLWKTACQAGVQDEGLLLTAARLGGDGTEIVRLLNQLHQQPEQARLVETLARQLVAPGWHAEGSWGARPDSDRQLIWWDFARPSERVPFGMSLTSAPISLVGKVGTRFRFSARWEILGVTDRCHLEITRDGKKWDKLTRYEGRSEWAEHEFDLQPYDGHVVQLRFHVLSGGQREGRGFEMADPRLECVPVTRRLSLHFPELSSGWQRRKSEDRHEVLSGHQSEVELSSAPLALPAMECPTLTLEGRLVASSVYAKATVQVEGAQGNQSLEIPTGSEWRSLRLPLQLREGEVVTRFSARFNSRKEEDGLWVRKLTICGGDPGQREIVPLDGGGDDGDKERLALLQILAGCELDKLRNLAALRRGLPSLRGALALLPLIKAPEHVGLLLELFSKLKEEAIPSFALLTELAEGEDLALQTRVLLTAGLPLYSTTRDHLGDGLVSPAEFAENCRLYLEMREHWSEQTARAGLGLLMTPIGGEGLAERATRFAQLLARHRDPEEFFAAWEQAWEITEE